MTAVPRAERNKNKNLRVIFFPSLILLTLIVLYLLVNHRMNNEPSKFILRIGASYLIHDLKAYDPTAIRAAGQMLFTDALFSKLLDFNENGEITGGIASSYQIKSNSEIHLMIRDDFSSIDGLRINAEDVVFSLKRLIISKSPFAKHFEELVAGCDQLKSPLDNCDGVYSSGNVVILKTKIHPDLILESLTATAFSIVLRNSCDENEKHDYEIIDFRNTSGPYFFKEINKNGHIVLSANPHHFNYHPRMPQTLEFFGTTDRKKSHEDDVFLALINGEIDYVPESGYISFKNQETVINSHPEFQVHTSFPVRVTSAKFTLTGREKPLAQRLAIAKKIRTMNKSRVNSTQGLVYVAEQYINKPGFGSLPDDQIKVYQEILDRADDAFNGAGFTIEIPAYRDDLVKSFKEALPDITIIEPHDYKIASTDRIIKATTDIVLSSEWPGITESYSMISWAIHSKTYALSENEGLSWISKYSLSASFEDRQKLLQDIHFKSLAIDPTIVPMSHSSFFACIRKPWRMHFSKVQFGSPFHLIRYED